MPLGPNEPHFGPLPSGRDPPSWGKSMPLSGGLKFSPPSSEPQRVFEIGSPAPDFFYPCDSILVSGTG